MRQSFLEEPVLMTLFPNGDDASECSVEVLVYNRLG